MSAAAQEPPPDRWAARRLRAIEWVSMRLPRPVGVRAGEAFMLLQWRRGGPARDVVTANMARVLGRPPDSPVVGSAVRECYRLYGRYWYETFALRSMPAEEVDRRFSIEGVEHVDAALAAGRGIILALPHMGNWDAAGHWLCINGYRMTAVAEELRPPEVFELFLRHRRALGMGIVPLTGDRSTGPRLVQLLAQNEIITLVADRDLTRRGVRVEMFGAPRLLPAGPAYLSLVAGAPLSAAAVFTTPEGWRCRIGPPIEAERTGTTRQEVTRLTNELARQFERYIAAAPVDWHMLQPGWDLPEDEPGRAGDGAGAEDESAAAGGAGVPDGPTAP